MMDSRHHQRQRYRLRAAVVACAVALLVAPVARAATSTTKPHPVPAGGPQPTVSGSIPLRHKPGSSLYYAYWEAANATTSTDRSSQRPILLWLQGGPGCASTFGAFYELGPHVTDKTGALMPNPWAWNKEFGLLVIDQPIGTGYSVAASKADIPHDMAGMAHDLYLAIWGFFDAHRQLQHRPLLITGESYAGKYVPSIAHYILQVEQNMAAAAAHTRGRCLRRSTGKRRSGQSHSEHSAATPAAPATSVWRRLLQQRQQHKQPHAQQPPCWAPKHAWPRGELEAPPVNFQLMGVAIGNGLVDPLPQTRALASVVFNMGLVSEAAQMDISRRTEDVVQLVQDGVYEQATAERSRLLEFIQEQSGVATLLDVRRTEAYDAHKHVDALLDSADVRRWMGAPDKVAKYSSCSSEVERVMSADVMRSCLVLVEDLLQVLPVLVYQGQFDAQDGVAGTNAWLQGLDWDDAQQFEAAEGQLWYASAQPGGAAAGWQRSLSRLTQAVLRNSGHMAPRDQPQAAQAMMHQWVADVLADAAEWGHVPWRTGAWESADKQQQRQQA